MICVWLVEKGDEEGSEKTDWYCCVFIKENKKKNVNDKQGYQI